MNWIIPQRVRANVQYVVVAAFLFAPGEVVGQGAVGDRSGRATVRLSHVLDRLPEQWGWGLTNIFFAPIPSAIQSAVQTGADWRATELADVVTGEGLQTIYAARFKQRDSDAWHYVIDTAGNLDFVHAVPLVFERRGSVAVANVALEVRARGGARRRVPYQILLSDDGYTYARVAEYLTGHLRIHGREYALKVRSGSRNDPFYGPTANTVFLVDLNGDGKFAEGATMTTDAGPTAAEQVFPRTPFRLSGNAFEITDVDSMGTRLVLRPSTVRVDAVENFKAPGLAATTLAGSAFRLSRQRGKVVSVEFWSVSCGFSEKVRPAVNALATAVRGRPFTWVAMARESDASEVRRFLVEHRMDATVAVIDSTAWNRYNPMGATPLFVVVDRNGIVRLRAVGAGAIDAVAARVKTLVSPTVRRPRRLAPTLRQQGQGPY